MAQNEASHTGRYLRDVLAVGRSNAYGARGTESRFSSGFSRGT